MSTVLGSALAFMAAVIRPSPGDARPLSKRQARRMLADAFIEALRVRPEDFYYANNLRYRLRDARTGQHWWVGNGALFFKLFDSERCSCSGVEVGFFNQLRCWNAYRGWQRSAAAKAQTEQEEEALKTIAANQARAS